MPTDFVEKNLAKAKYKIIEDGSYFGEIPGLRGVWANNKNLEKCKEELKETIEEWLNVDCSAQRLIAEQNNPH